MSAAVESAAPWSSVEWERAACRGADPEVFFGTAVSNDDWSGPAKVWCRRCPIAAGCLRYALGHDVDGVWGGTTSLERRRIRAEHGLPAPAPMVLSTTWSPRVVSVAAMTRGGLVRADRRSARDHPAVRHQNPQPSEGV